VRSKSVRYLVVLALIAVSVGAATNDAEPAYAANVSPRHWERCCTHQPQQISLEYRNQIGPDEAPYINDALAKWGSADPPNFFPSGPARTDFSFSYVYGGPPSCNSAAPFRVITFCVIAVADQPGMSGNTHRFYNTTTNHIITAYVTIRVDYRYVQGTYCHEWGHTLGLSHSTVSPSCHIDPHNADVPNQDDIDTSVSHNSHTH
jgi:hypothetical protein